MQHDEVYNSRLPSQFSEAVHPPSVASILTHLGLAEAGDLSRLPVEQLIVALNDPRWERRASVATALGKLGQHAPIDPLIQALEDKSEKVRAAAARALGHIENSAATLALERALRDPHPLVREAAATTLGKIGVDTSCGPLTLALLDEEEEVRAAAAQALARVGDTTIIPLLETLLHDPQPLVREAAVLALGEMGDPGTRHILIAHIQDEELLVRDAIAHVLQVLQSPVSREMIHLLFCEKEPSVQPVARAAASLLIDLGWYIHEEEASLAPLAVALQSSEKDIEKMVMCYLMGRALDLLDKSLSLKPLLDTLYQSHQPLVEEGVWRIVYTLTQDVLQERKIWRLLVTAANDSDSTVRKEIDQAVQWLLELALTLQEERGNTKELQTILEDKGHPSHRMVICQLIKQALDALEEREPIEAILAGLREGEAETRAEVGRKLTKRARKALLGRMPGGDLVMTLRDPSEYGPQATPLQLQFGDDVEPKADVKEGRYVFPWAGPPKLKLPSLPEKPRNFSLGLTLGNLCYK